MLSFNSSLNQLFHSKTFSSIINMISVHWNCVDSIDKYHGGLSERYCNGDLGLIPSQDQFMLSTGNSFKLII